MKVDSSTRNYSGVELILSNSHGIIIGLPREGSIEFIPYSAINSVKLETYKEAMTFLSGQNCIVGGIPDKCREVFKYEWEKDENVV